MQEGKGCNKEGKQVGTSIHLTHTMNGVWGGGEDGGDGIIYIQLKTGSGGYISRMLTKILETRSTTNGLCPKERTFPKVLPISLLKWTTERKTRWQHR